MSLRARGRSSRGRGTGRSARCDDGQGKGCPSKGVEEAGQLFTKIPFVGSTPGPTTTSTRESARACFNRFYTDEVWDLLVTETNLYAEQSRRTLNSPTPRSWHDTTKDEMRAFVGVLMAMGL